MAALKDIPGIGKAALELLDASGIRDSAHLARQEPDKLFAELTRANEVLSLVKRVPGKSAVEKWIAGAAELEGVEIAEEQPQEKIEQEEPSAPLAPPVNYEQSPQVAEMLEQAPLAIPLPGKVMMERKLRVSDVPAALLLNRYSGDLDVRVGNPEVGKNGVPSRKQSVYTATIEAPGQDPFDSSTVKPLEPAKKGKRMASRPKEGHELDRVALIRSPLEKTNRGKNPESRRYIRGVLHTHPVGLRIGAISAILLLFVLPLAVVSAFLLLASREMPDSLPWVPQWILAFPIALPLVGLFYFIWGFHGKCRICNQKLFVHKGALKHIKAHHSPGLGYVFPLCIHLLTFSWFRCSSCGTPVRLKK
ncbi:MAG: DUF4332 domain-containing protein [Akkermansiaceae bacterium]|jgi:hypothetical protein|nr:DUF4332 domain-containing protein [Akkermansiaceae bacterium]MDP4645632.1 DUF4332 domain-containing protein [Akkermansiaceae bacterium]MDP4721530.1 DUF4332 domain-containing protein [Akkermansiaceae bacterium]MDP4778740.1 DUF4332 domain-containing protein [Akkermansiaceae bacterium]MDP4847447.1 DUF4332 domain-containing protein [Akkermansiaceae bacterium]